MADYRALCEELLDELLFIREGGDVTGLDQTNLVTRVCDALNEPPLPPPSLKRLERLETVIDQYFGYLLKPGIEIAARDAIEELARKIYVELHAYRPAPTDQELYDYWISTSPKFGCADPVGFARAVLEKYGS